MDNLTIVRQLLNMAHSLEKERRNLYRVRAYRQAAQTIRGLDRPVEDMLLEDGRHALQDLPGIGASLSAKIETLVHTGNFPMVKDREEKMLVAV